MKIDISYFAKSTKVQSTLKLSLISFLRKIQNGEWKKYQDIVQNTKNVIKKAKIKKYETPGVTLSGVYEKRVGNPDEHSSYICMDVDFQDNKDIQKKREELIEDEYVHACFTSISGKGLAVLFKIKPSKHVQSFIGIQKYLYDEYDIIVDPLCKDQTRLRFVSYDPDCYYDLSKKVFDKLISSKPTPKLVNEEHSEEDVKTLVEQIVKQEVDIVPNYHEWYIVGQALAILGEAGRKFYHSISKFGEEYNKKKCDEQFDNCLKQEQNGIRDNKVGLGSIFYFAKEYGVTLDGPKIVSSKKHKLIEKHDERVLLSMEGHRLEKNIYVYHIWGFKVTFKKDETPVVECMGLNPEAVSDFLYNKGVRVNLSEFYQIKNSIVRRIIWQDVMDIVIQEGVRLPKSFEISWDEDGDSISRKAILNRVQEKGKRTTSDISLKRFDIEKIDWITDEKDCCYIPFQNGIVIVDKEGFELREYKDIKGYVWEDTIIKRDFKYVKRKSLIQDVLENAIGKQYWKETQTALGYMCHNYIDKEGGQILFCIDKYVGDMNEGGNGKDFTRQILAEIRRTVVLPGKSLNVHHQFAFEKLNRDTELMWIEDMGKHIKMEQLYNLTEGVHVRRMHTSPFVVRCKVGVSLQHLIDIEGSSDERRQIFLIFSDFYSKVGGIGKFHKVRNIFGEVWNEWNEYYSMMINAIQLYFKEGVLKMDNSVLMEARENELNSNGDFGALEYGIWYTSKKAIKECWMIDEPDIATMMEFKKKLAMWCKNKGLEFHAEVKTIKNVRHKSIMIKVPMKIVSSKKAIQ